MITKKQKHPKDFPNSQAAFWTLNKGIKNFEERGWVEIVSMPKRVPDYDKAEVKVFVCAAGIINIAFVDELTPYGSIAKALLYKRL